jgi:hypothetical protein
MVIDFQHHYIPVELAKKRGLYSDTGRTLLQEGGLPTSTSNCDPELLPRHGSSRRGCFGLSAAAD